MAIPPQGTQNNQGTQLVAETRTEFGKGAARRIRRDRKIPAVIYGHGEPVRHVSLPGHATMLALKLPNALLSLDLGEGQPTLAVVKDVQREPVKRAIEHIDLVIVRRGERIEVSVPVHLQGEAAPGTVVTVEHNTLLVTAEATHLPETIVVDVEGAAVGTRITAAELDLPAGTAIAGDPEAVVVTVLAAPTAEDLDAELAEAESELGIERDEKDVDVEAAAAGEDGDAAS